MVTHCSFGNTKKMLSYYRVENCIEKFCKTLKKHAERIIYWKKKEMITLTDEEYKSYENKKHCYICKKKLLMIIKK